MKKLIFTFCALLAAVSALRADTSYLLIQGPFGAGSAVQTYQWKVLYAPGSLITGLDLLNAVLGAPVKTGTTYTDGFAGTYDLYRAGSTAKGASYIDFSIAQNGSQLFTLSFTLNSTAVAMSSFYDPGWNYYVAGGAYASNAWTYSDDGIGTRTLADGSFDGWVFGTTFPEAPIAPTATAGDNNPVSGNFAAATVVNVPEPGSAGMLILGVAGLLIRRRRL